MALVGACIVGNLSLVQKLVEDGASVNASNDKGFTPLDQASYYGHPEVVNFLLCHGAEVNAKDNGGFSPLHCASQEGHPEVVNCLLFQGAEVDARTNIGYSPLHWASLKGHPEVANCLLSQGAEVDARDNEGFSPLHLASQEGHPEVVNCLLSQGAEVDARTNKGHSPLHLASGDGHPEVVNCLLSQGAEVDARTKLGFTPLHCASQQGRVSTAELLLSKGANIEAKTNKEWTAISLASGSGMDVMVDYLVKQGARLDVGENRALKIAATRHFANKAKKGVIESILTKPELNFKGGDDTYMSWSAQEKLSLVKTCNTRLVTAGEVKSGKTSLARSIISMTQYRAYESDRTVVVEQRQWHMGTKTIPIVDLGGHKSYRVTGMFFLTNAPNNVVLLCHNILSDRYILTYHWIKDIICQAPEAHIIPVLTRTDQLPTEKSLQDYTKTFSDAITRHLAHDLKSLELKSLLAKSDATKAKINIIAKCYRNLLDKFEDRIIKVSTAPLKGETIEYLKEKIKDYSSLPQNQVEMPGVYQLFYQQIGCIGTKAEEKHVKVSSADIPDPINVNLPQPESKEIEDSAANVSLDVRPKQKEKMSILRKVEEIEDPGANVLSDVQPKQKEKMSFFKKVHQKVTKLKFGKTNSKEKNKSSSQRNLDKDDASATLAIYERVVPTYQSRTSKGSTEITAPQESLPSSSYKQEEQDLHSSALNIPTDTPYLLFDHVKAIFEQTERQLKPGPLQHDVRKCLTTLHNLGLIMAFSGTKNLEQYVFNNHSTIVQILKSMFHHETDNFLNYEKLEAKDQALFKGSKETFRHHHNLLNRQGIMTKPIMQTLLHQNGCDIDESFVIDLIIKLNIGYQFIDQMNMVEHMFIPYFVEENIIPHDIIEQIQPAMYFTDGNLALNLKIMGNITQTYFNRTIMLIYQLLHLHNNHSDIRVWGKGMYSTYGSQKVIVCYDGSEEIKICVVGKPQLLPKMWDHLVEIHDGMEVLREEWCPGLIEDFIMTCVYENMSTSSNHESTDECTLKLEDVLSKPLPDVCYCRATGQKIPAAFVTRVVQGSSDCEKMIREAEDFIEKQNLLKKDEWEILALQTMHVDPVIAVLFTKGILSLSEKLEFDNLGVNVFSKIELLLKKIEKKNKLVELSEALSETRYHTNISLSKFMTGKCEKEGTFLTNEDTSSITKNFWGVFVDNANVEDLKDELIVELIFDTTYQREEFAVRQTTTKQAQYLMNYILLRGTVQTVQGFYRAINVHQPDVGSYLAKAVPNICKIDNI